MVAENVSRRPQALGTEAYAKTTGMPKCLEHGEAWGMKHHGQGMKSPRKFTAETSQICFPMGKKAKFDTAISKRTSHVGIISPSKVATWLTWLTKLGNSTWKLLMLVGVPDLMKL